MTVQNEHSFLRILGRQSASHDDLFRWVLMMALVGLGALILWDYGFIHYLLRNDVSRVSAAILVLFVFGSLHCVWNIYRLCDELRSLEGAADDAARIGSVKGRIAQAATDVQALKFRTPDASADLLLQATGSSLRSPVRFGIFAADTLYKMGLLGTVIGFVLMLDPMRGLGGFDTETMRLALQQMTTGMAVALLTTITGLVCGALLRFQFVLLENLVQRALRRLVRFSEVELPQHEAAAARV